MLTSIALLIASCSFNATILMPRAAEMPLKPAGSCAAFQMPKIPEAPKMPTDKIAALDPKSKEYGDKAIAHLIKALEDFHQFEKVKDALIAKAYEDYIKQCVSPV